VDSSFIEYIDKEKCNGCGMCVKVCSRGVYEIQELNGRKISVAVNAGNCVGDGSCHMVCRPNAIVCHRHKSHLHSYDKTAYYIWIILPDRKNLPVSNFN